MTQNPSPTTGRQLAQQNKPAALKRDINLLPPNQGSAKAAKLGIIALAVLVGAALFAYFMILTPLLNLQREKNKADALEKQAEQIEAMAAEFDTRIQVRNGLQEMQTILDSSEAGYTHPSDLFKLVSGACPNSITLVSAAVSNGSMSIKGLADSDKDVAQFIVNLRAISCIYGAGLNSTGDSEAYALSDARPRVFELTASLAPAATGGDGK
jgi:Tfp pilus assembly protein PilN